MAGRLRRRMALAALLRVFKPGTPGLGRRLRAFPRMIRATMRGEYDGKGRLSMMAISALYMLSPIDLVPEAFFLAVGLIDDAAVATFLVGAILDETERFLEWERQRARVIPGHVGRGSGHVGRGSGHVGRG
jgi:uncharacterized membrane protein YkvA (DUF1232 family)